MYRDGTVVTLMKDPYDDRFSKYEDVVITAYHRGVHVFEVQKIGAPDKMCVFPQDITKR